MLDDSVRNILVRNMRIDGAIAGLFSTVGAAKLGVAGQEAGLLFGAPHSFAQAFLCLGLCTLDGGFEAKE
jgi:hypothetical protein